MLSEVTLPLGHHDQGLFFVSARSVAEPRVFWRGSLLIAAADCVDNQNHRIPQRNDNENSDTGVHKTSTNNRWVRGLILLKVLKRRHTVLADKRDVDHADESDRTQPRHLV